jgi:rare lipoprotein A
MERAMRAQVGMWQPVCLASCLALCACAGAETPAPQPRGARTFEPPSDIGPANTRFDPRVYYEKRALFVLDGVASYYGDEFAGRSTANGEKYDPDAYTAAHRTLPFGTIIRVTRRSTGEWVLVRVNDRGPYGKRKRILDLSKQAARRLGMLHDGIAKVRAEVLEVGRK